MVILYNPEIDANIIINVENVWGKATKLIIANIRFHFTLFK